MVVDAQTAAWMKQVRIKEAGTSNMQFENKYEGSKHPFSDDLPAFLDYTWHPKPNMLNLKYSHGGEWVKIPRKQGDQTGPNYTWYHMGRIESYLDKAGVTRKAVAYGRDAGTMKIWFNYEEVMQALGTWVIPEVPYWYNNKKWNNKLRKEHEKKDNSEKSDNEQSKKNDQNKKKEDPRKGQKHQNKSYDPRRGELDTDHYPEDYYHRERHSYPHDPRVYSDWEEDYDIPHQG